MFLETAQQGRLNSYGDIFGSISREINLSRIGWLLLMVLYCGTGLGAAFVSFLMQKDVFYQVTREGMFSFWVVLILETAKVGTIVVYGFLFKSRSEEIGAGMRGFIKLFRTLLILLSFTCSLALIAFGLDRPNLEKVRTEDQARVETRYAQRQEQLKARHEADIQGIRERYSQGHEAGAQRLRQHYGPIIEGYRRDLKVEMNNVIRGHFKGPRYHEFERLLQETEAEYQKKLAELRKAQAEDLTSLEERIRRMQKEYEDARARLGREKETELRNVLTHTYARDERAGNRMIAALLRTINDGLLWYADAELPLVTFTCVFAIIVALLLEMTIFLCLHSGVLSFSPNVGRMFEFYEREDDVKKNW